EVTQPAVTHAGFRLRTDGCTPGIARWGKKAPRLIVAARFVLLYRLFDLGDRRWRTQQGRSFVDSRFVQRRWQRRCRGSVGPNGVERRLRRRRFHAEEDVDDSQKEDT